MTKKQSISFIMKKHHGQIEGLLNKFYKFDENYQDKLKLFYQFKWELEKHFFTEEKAIFFFINDDTKNSNEMKLKLMKEHDKILTNLKEIENNLKNKKDLEILDFRELLVRHKKFEDETFYPTLDQDLDENKKKDIMNRLSNPI